MNKITWPGKLMAFITAIIALCACGTVTHDEKQKESIIHQEGLKVYQNENLVVRKLSDHIYLHTSYLNTESFGKVDCNGMVVVNDAEAVVFDTPVDDSSSAALLHFFINQLQHRIKAVIPTHFHEDCIGGINQFQAKNIPVYASAKTVAQLQSNKNSILNSATAFEDTLQLQVGDNQVIAQYFGEGHTSDNIVGYYPAGETLFGGCLIKALGASRGNLQDANVNGWAATVRKIKKNYPGLKIVIPGHGQWGDASLLDYTTGLFDKPAE